MKMKGSLPLLILHLLAQGPSHGYGLAKKIRQRSEGALDFAEGTLYPTLHSMEKQGLIESFEGEDTGRARRYYRLTGRGRASLPVERADWERYSAGVNMVLGEIS